MKITLTLSDDQLYSVLEYLKTQRTPQVDQMTGATVIHDIYAGPEDLFQQKFTELVHSVTLQYPPPALRAMFEQRKALEASIRDASKPLIDTTAK